MTPSFKRGTNAPVADLSRVFNLSGFTQEDYKQIPQRTAHPNRSGCESNPACFTKHECSYTVPRSPLVFVAQNLLWIRGNFTPENRFSASFAYNQLAKPAS